MLHKISHVTTPAHDLNVLKFTNLKNVEYNGNFKLTERCFMVIPVTETDEHRTEVPNRIVTRKCVDSRK